MIDLAVALALRSAFARLPSHVIQGFIATGQLMLTVPGLGQVVLKLERE